MRVQWIVFAELLLAITAGFAYYYWPQALEYPAPPIPQIIRDASGQTVISWSGRVFVAEVGEFDSVLPAYLIFDYLRSEDFLRGTQVLLTAEGPAAASPYRIWVHLPDDVLTGVEEIAVLKEHHLMSALEGSWIDEQVFSRYVRQTNRFVHAFNSPHFPKMEQLTSTQIEPYVREFICFKAHVDPRTWGGSRGSLPELSAEEADDMAADIVEVAKFYDLPVDVLLGVGAMENNFLDAPGDLNNAIWKKDAGTDDIVLRRRGRKAWVLNSSIGTWQITRQSLRHAQELFLCDTRDYSRLPIELRPTAELDMNFLSSHVLTTYAALLLRDLLDHFDGDVFLATAAYNGTELRPNLQYAAGVETVAKYARRVIGSGIQWTRSIEGKSAGNSGS